MFVSAAAAKDGSDPDVVFISFPDQLLLPATYAWLTYRYVEWPQLQESCSEMVKDHSHGDPSTIDARSLSMSTSTPYRHTYDMHPPYTL